jgi:hypothetical protein
MEGNDFEITINGNLHRFTSAELPEKDPKVFNFSYYRNNIVLIASVNSIGF